MCRRALISKTFFIIAYWFKIYEEERKSIFSSVVTYMLITSLTLELLFWSASLISFVCDAVHKLRKSDSVITFYLISEKLDFSGLKFVALILTSYKVIFRGYLYNSIKHTVVVCYPLNEDGWWNYFFSTFLDITSNIP